MTATATLWKYPPREPEVSIHKWNRWGNGNECLRCGTVRRVTSPEYGKARMEFNKGGEWSDREPRCRFDA